MGGSFIGQVCLSKAFLAGDRAGSRVDLDPEQAAWQALNMTSTGFGHGGTITPASPVRSTNRSTPSKALFD